MGYNLELQSKKIAGQVNIFDSSMIRWVTGGVTIDAATVSADADGNKILKAGTPIGRITASGKYGPYQPAVVGAKATGKTTVDTTEVTFKADEKKAVYNGVTIAFVGGGTDGAETAVWSEKKLTVTLDDAKSYAHTAIQTILQGATDGAPTDVDATKLTVETSITKDGEKWAAAEDVVLAGGVADVPAADDGRQTAVLMIAEDVDCTGGDQVTTAFDMARVISARLPVTVTAELKSHLSNITFV